MEIRTQAVAHSSLSPRRAVAPDSRILRGMCGVFIGLTLIAVTGCSAFRPLKGMPSNYFPRDLRGDVRSGKRTIDLSLLRQNPPPNYLIDSGDVLGIYIEGVLGKREEVPPVYFPEKGEAPPSLGYPIPVREDGTISLPLSQPLSVRGMTIREVEEAIRADYTQEHKILQEGQDRILVSLQRPRTYKVLVIRQETAESAASHAMAGMVHPGGVKRGTGKLVSLPAYRNDVLHALAETGGLPGLDAENTIYVIRRKGSAGTCPPVGGAGPLVPGPSGGNCPPPGLAPIVPRQQPVQLEPARYSPEHSYRSSRSQNKGLIVPMSGTANNRGTGIATALGGHTAARPVEYLPSPAPTANTPQRLTGHTSPGYPAPGTLQPGYGTPGYPAPSEIQPVPTTPYGAQSPALAPTSVPVYPGQPGMPAPACGPTGGPLNVASDGPLPPWFPPEVAAGGPADYLQWYGRDTHVIRIPVRLNPGERADFRESDIILQEGDIVFIESRETEIFYTGGLLGGGQYVLPRDYDLDVLGAIAIASGRTAGGTSGTGFGSRVGGISALNQDISVSASDVIILRQFPNGTQVPIKVDLHCAMRDPAHRVPIQPGDYIVLQYKRHEAIAAFIERNLLAGSIIGLAATSGMSGGSGSR